MRICCDLLLIWSLLLLLLLLGGFRSSEARRSATKTVSWMLRSPVTGQARTALPSRCPESPDSLMNGGRSVPASPRFVARIRLGVFLLSTRRRVVLRPSCSLRASVCWRSAGAVQSVCGDEGDSWDRMTGGGVSLAFPGGLTLVRGAGCRRVKSWTTPAPWDGHARERERVIISSLKYW